MMRSRTLGRIVGLLFLVGAVTVGAAGCLLVPIPVGDGGHDHHGHGRYRHW